LNVAFNQKEWNQETRNQDKAKEPLAIVVVIIIIIIIIIIVWLLLGMVGFGRCQAPTGSGGRQLGCC
jgi:flagellar basal body-associated protein FliL